MNKTYAKQQAIKEIDNIFLCNGYKESQGDNWLGPRLMHVRDYVESSGDMLEALKRALSLIVNDWTSEEILTIQRDQAFKLLNDIVEVSVNGSSAEIEEVLDEIRVFLGAEPSE